MTHSLTLVSIYARGRRLAFFVPLPVRDGWRVMPSIELRRICEENGLRILDGTTVSWG